MIPAALRVNQLSYGYRAPLFEPLTFCCQKGEIWAVLGRNGLGKSTLLDTLTGTLPALGGSIENNGGIGIVAQHSHLPFPYTVSDVVLMGRAQHVKLFAQPSQQDQQRAMQALEQLSIAHLASSSFGSLSGGQQQLVMIARALVTVKRCYLMNRVPRWISPISRWCSSSSAIWPINRDAAFSFRPTIRFTRCRLLPILCCYSLKVNGGQGQRTAL